MTAQRRPAPKIAAKTEAASRQKLRLWLRLLRTSRVVEAELRERLRVAFGTTLAKFDVLAALERRPAGMTMTELSRCLMVSNGNVTGLIDRLVAEGMVMRRPHEDDRRATFVRLTAKGARQFASMARAHETWVNDILAHLSGEDTQTMIVLLSNPGFTSRKPAATEH